MNMYNILTARKEEINKEIEDIQNDSNLETLAKEVKLILLNSELEDVENRLYLEEIIMRG